MMGWKNFFRFNKAKIIIFAILCIIIVIYFVFPNPDEFYKNPILSFLISIHQIIFVGIYLPVLLLITFLPLSRQPSVALLLQGELTLTSKVIVFLIFLVYIYIVSMALSYFSVLFRFDRWKLKKKEIKKIKK
jgi:hypothetical protein